MKYAFRSLAVAVFFAGWLAPAVAAAQVARRVPERAPLGPKPAYTVLGPDHDGCALEVKFAHDSAVRLRAGRFDALHPEVAEIDAWLEAMGAKRARVFTQDEERLERLRVTGEARSGRPLHDLNLFYRVELSQPGTAAAVCDLLNRYDVVEIAYPLGRIEDPVVRLVPAAQVTTPDFEPQQDYRNAAPLGVDADYGNTFSGGIGTGTLLADVETGWTDDHEDLAHKADGNYIGLTGSPYPWDHGTAVLGELVGEHNGAGVRGIVYDADVAMSSHLGDPANFTTAVGFAIAAAQPGDFVIIEVQCFGTPPGPFPCEYVDSLFAAVDVATANGIHVTAAAGNGNNDLDQAAYGGKFDRNVRDSGAIIVGASNGSSLDKASFSNYGSRLDAHGWGFDVTTSGYGDLWAAGPSARREYTSTFSGTSSATPIVTGAAAILNGIHRAVFGAPIDPLVLRATLTLTGTPQGSGGQIGPRPNVRTAITALGIPHIAVAGPAAAGGRYRIDVEGPPLAPYALYFSRTLRAAPLAQPRRGFLLLGDPVRLVGVGRTRLDGHGVSTGPIPPNAPIGVYGYFQALVFQQPTRPEAAFTNQDDLVVN